MICTEQEDSERTPSKVLLGLQVFICRDKNVESCLLDQRQQPTVFRRPPALPGHGRHRSARKVITNLSRNAFIDDDTPQGWS